jgi:hypothetical protein
MSQARITGRLVAVIAALCLISVLCFAQSDTAQLSGSVRDPSQAVVANAKVVVRNEATGLTRSAETNEQGYYTITSLPPGYYTVTVEAAGFKKYSSTNNKLDPNLAAQVNATLDVGALTETVEVVASVTNVEPKPRPSASSSKAARSATSCSMTQPPLPRAEAVFAAAR